MKVILEFNAEEEDYANVAMHGVDLYLVLVKMDEWLRNTIKYPPQNTSEETLKAYDKVRSTLYDIMEEYKVNTEMLP